MDPYVPQLNFVYPDKPDERMFVVKVKRKAIVDEHYPFLNKSFRFRFMRGFIYCAIYTLAFIFIWVRLGLKIEGREILRKHRKLLKNGAMTVSNHVHRWDFLCILKAIRYRSMYFPAWKGNLDGPDGNLIRYTGGIPIPEEIRTISYFNKAFDEIREKKKWIHAYAEGCMFPYYQPIRPFKKGVFSMAHRYNLPILPLAFSYRKPNIPYSLVNLYRSIMGKQKLPMITLRIGEPLLIDPNLPRKEAVQKIRKECHEAIVRLAGIGNNQYPAEGD